MAQLSVLRASLSKTVRNFYIDADLDEFINRAVDRLVRAFHWQFLNRQTTINAVAGEATAALPANWKYTFKIGTNLEQDDKELAAYNYDGYYDAGSGKKHYIRWLTLPTGNTTYTLAYYANATPMTDNAHTPDIPDDELIISLAEYLALKDMGADYNIISAARADHADALRSAILRWNLEPDGTEAMIPVSSTGVKITQHGGTD